MTRPALPLVAALSLALVSPLALAGKKKKKDKGEDAPAAEAKADLNIPGDGDSKKFAETLTTITVEGFRPTDGAGAKFEYNTLSFQTDNTWTAAGFIEIMDEKMECTESGTWSMEPAESAKTATVSWTVTQSDCPGVDHDRESRALLTLSKSGIDSIKFR